MTASTLTQPILMAGGALAASAGRAGMWAFSKYMRAPLASTGLMAMVTLTALAGSNALYFQTAEHPSPFFAPAAGVPATVVAPVPAPAVQRQNASDSVLPALGAPSADTTGSVAAAPRTIPDEPVGNAEVFAVQKKLAELKLFDGTVDGYYGPKTAGAIRTFEERNGLTPMGALSASVVAAILNADTSGQMTTPVPQPAAQPQPQPQALVAPPPAQPVAVAATQPAAPVALEPVAPAPTQQVDQVVARLPQLSPAEQTLDQVAIAAAETLDSIVAAVDGSRTQPSAMANPPIPSVPVAEAQPMPAPVAPASQTQPASLTVAAASSAPTAAAVPPANDTQLVSQIQRGLASLGFFRAQVDGKPGPETARAIREFENFHRYRITGQVQPDLVGLLQEAGANI